MSLDPRRTVVLVNPAAGGGRAGKAWEKLLAAAPELGETRIVRAADAAASITELDAQLAEDTAAVVAFGGDGTAHLVVNRLLESGRASDVAFGLVPAGTGSDLARTLGLPRRPSDVWRRLRDAEPTSLDALVVETDDGRRRYVVNIASAGLPGEVDLKVNAVADRGHLTYLSKTLQAIFAYRPSPCRVLVDGEELHDGEFFLVAVANGQYFGKGMRVAPEASPTDGLADVVLVPPVPLWHLPVRLPQFLTGRHLKVPIVRHLRAKSVRFEPHGEMPPFDVDGETLASGPATVRVLEGALWVLA